MTAASAGGPARDRRRALVALFACVFAFSISLGGLVPLMALILEGRGVNEAMIGLVSAANPIGVLLAAPIVPAMVRRFGTADTLIGCGIVSVVSTALLPVFDSTGSWLGLRLLSGLAGAGPWVVIETWINVVAERRTRGRVIAVYGAIMAAGFAAGPAVLTVLGTGLVVPFATFAVLHGLALLPILLVRGIAPVLDLSEPIRLTGIVLAIPSLLAGAFIAGAVDTAFFSFLPIWGLRTGLEETFAVTLLSIFVAGNVVLQFPIGWLADVAGYRPVMAACGLACIAGPIAAPALLGTPALLAAAMFVWGGCAWGIYSVALAALGERFAGGMLATANSAFVVAYVLANIAGPPLAGLSIEAFGPHGLMALMGALAGAFTLLVAVRGFARGWRDG